VDEKLTDFILEALKGFVLPLLQGVGKEQQDKALEVIDPVLRDMLENAEKFGLSLTFGFTLPYYIKATRLLRENGLLEVTE
jgi:hypothetical protein